MWDQIDLLLERAPHDDALRLHRVELLEARRRRARGLDVGSLAADETAALIRDLAVIPLLTHVREAWDGALVLHKGPEVSLDYPGPRLRRFTDLDVLTDDAPGAQAALLAAGFITAREEECRGVEHHECPLMWPGLPLTVEIHNAPHWVKGMQAPPTPELVATAVPSRVGIDGISTLAPAEHVLVLAAHAWSHEALGRLGNLIDVAAALKHTDEAEVAALAQRWGCQRMWRTTRAAIEAVLNDNGRSVAVGSWARHLREVRERTVMEWHAKSSLAPIWGLPGRRVPGALAAEARATVVPRGVESWSAKVRRATLAFRNAGNARSAHQEALHARAAKHDLETR